jgi:hypothetical protein
VRGGGHSPMGWGTSNGLVIDLAGMNRVTIDPARCTGRIDAGLSSGEVMRLTARYGLAPVLGQCPGVGAAGVTLGGGLGWLSGLHGAACDNLLSARMVTADGRILSVDAERNPDLLWALRGAGANFGVTTSLDCRLHSVGPVTSGDIYYPVREARPVLRFFRTLMAEAPDSFQATLNLTPGSAACSSVSVTPVRGPKPCDCSGLSERWLLPRKIPSGVRNSLSSRADPPRAHLASTSGASRPFTGMSCRMR